MSFTLPEGSSIRFRIDVLRKRKEVTISDSVDIGTGLEEVRESLQNVIESEWIWAKKQKLSRFLIDLSVSSNSWKGGFKLDGSFKLDIVSENCGNITV